MGIAIDLKQPFRAAQAMLCSPVIVPTDAPLPSHPSAWLFHLDARNVVATEWHPVWNDGQVSGLRVRMLETEGRAATATLRSLRPFQSARKIDGVGNTCDTCVVSDDRLTFTVKPFEQVDVEALF